MNDITSCGRVDLFDVPHFVDENIECSAGELANVSVPRDVVSSSGRVAAAVGREKWRRTKICPFNEKNTSSKEFLGKLQRMVQTGKAMEAPSAPGRVIVVQKDGFLGEGAGGWRIFKGLTSAGYECCLCDGKSSQWLSAINPTFAIAMHHSVKIPRDILSALVVSFNQNGTNAKKACNYDCLLYSAPNINGIADGMRKLGAIPKGVQFFPSVEATEFSDGPKERLIFIGCLWDKRRKCTYAELWRMLDETDYFDAYGPKWSTWAGLAPRSWRGFLNFDQEEFLKTIRECGISLILHADAHLHSGTPAWRIFEAAASSCVIISDRHRFVEDNFGDSVFYVDQSAGPEKMFERINEIVEWVKANPAEAQEMARRSHSIFLEKYTLELQIKAMCDAMEKIRAGMEADGAVA
ncbi:MAG: glycosyltransferase [Puniceicoccales bacterium]|nr:glycosyltransferase [Puniceicoccales bacterium]